MPEMLRDTTAQRYGCSPVPDHAGVGLKPQHFADILARQPDIGWFEIHPENYLLPGGPMLHNLGLIREQYPLSFHCVGLSPGSASGINTEHVQRIRNLSERFEPALISDHLSWSNWHQCYLNDLLPLPYSRQAMQLLCDNIDRIQNILDRQIAIENPSTYLQMQDSVMGEAEFLAELCNRSGADILLDINNIYVSACNHGWQAKDYINRIPANKVSEYHLAGHLQESLEDGRILRIDDHGSRVCPEVWELYEHALQTLGPRPTLIEWDTNVPALEVLLDEARLAEHRLASRPLRKESACA